MSSEFHAPHRVRNTVVACAIAMLTALLLAASASPAFAHDELLGADPADGARLDALPAQIELTFSGVLMDEPGATEVSVTDAAGSSLTDGEPVVDGTRLRQALTGEASGTVTVLWRVVSSDAHPISGEYSFTVGDGTATTAPAPPADAGGVDPLPLVIAAIVLVAGILIVVLLSRKRPSRED